MARVDVDRGGVNGGGGDHWDRRRVDPLVMRALTLP